MLDLRQESRSGNGPEIDPLPAFGKAESGRLEIKNGAVDSAAPFRSRRAFTLRVLQPAMSAGEKHRLAPVYGSNCTRTASAVKHRQYRT
jgi:hypothetical protein